MSFEVSGERRRLWLDAGRRSAAPALLSRNEIESLAAPAELTGRDRHALLLLRKHVDGRRVGRIARLAGARTLVLDAGPLLLLRLSGTPALTLVAGGEAVATVGEGAPVAMAAGAEDAVPVAADTPPALALPAPLDACHDRELASPKSVRLGLGAADGTVVHPTSWLAAAAQYVVACRRGARFEAAQRAALGEARRELRRLGRLETNLVQDIAGLPSAEELRRQGEALLASLGAVAPGIARAELPDPYEAGRLVRLALDPRLSAAANADRLFAKARRISRARETAGARLAETRSELAWVRAREAQALEARDLRDLRPPTPAQDERARGKGPLHYLTSRGLSVLVGRGARENHHLTFAVARPEDLWLHARDVPGAHVILRDNEGRSTADDLREAAELAAFFSDARGQSRVDVHVTRRKHVRPARRGPGRVHVHHSDTLRVEPKDPAGRLRRR